MGEGVVVRPDQVSLGVLVSAVPRDAVDDAVVACGVGDKRLGGKLPAHVTAYLTMALCLFADDDYAEVATKVTGSLSRWGCWDAGWSVPTTGGITQARKRLGPKVLAEVFERVAGPVATMATQGAWLRRWRLLAIDGFEVDVPDTDANAAEFGYAGSGDNRSAFPKARVVALAECGTHAFVAAEVGAWAIGAELPQVRRGVRAAHHGAVDRGHQPATPVHTLGGRARGRAPQQVEQDPQRRHADPAPGLGQR
jgi:hypothetical protein